MNRDFADHIAMTPDEAQQVAMNWIQGMAECWACRAIVPGPEQDPETQDTVVRNMTEFFSYYLPRLHDALGTHPWRAGTYVISLKEVACD